MHNRPACLAPQVRDIKPDNFLFLDRRDNSPLLMIDFGLACHCAPGQNLTDRAGTPIYVAPEVLKQRYGLPSDLWSVGEQTTDRFSLQHLQRQS